MILIRTFGGFDVKDIAVCLEHVDFLNTSERLNGQLLQSSLQLRVFATGDSALRLLHYLAAWSTLTTCAHSALQLGELFLINNHSSVQRSFVRTRKMNLLCACLALTARLILASSPSCVFLLVSSTQVLQGKFNKRITAAEPIIT